MKRLNKTESDYHSFVHSLIPNLKGNLIDFHLDIWEYGRSGSSCAIYVQINLALPKCLDCTAPLLILILEFE